MWPKERDAIYTRIIQHIHKFRRDILYVISHNQTNKEKVKDIFKSEQSKRLLGFFIFRLTSDKNKSKTNGKQMENKSKI